MTIARRTVSRFVLRPCVALDPMSVRGCVCHTFPSYKQAMSGDERMVEVNLQRKVSWALLSTWPVALVVDRASDRVMGELHDSWAAAKGKGGGASC